LLPDRIVSHIDVASASAVVALKMRHHLLLSSLVALVGAQQLSDGISVRAPLAPDQDGKYTLQSEGIRAQFIPYGASLTNLFILDQHGVERDIVMGFDNASHYALDTTHPHLGGVPGKLVLALLKRTRSFKMGKDFHLAHPLRMS
jgi:aldose 1-epimerase